MRFFKHFTDAHRGQSMQNLLDALGHAGLCYWPLVEICAEKLDEKMEEKGGERLTETDCVFTFHPRIVRQNLRLSLAKLQVFLSVCQTNGLLSFEFTENSLKIFMPKLLKCLERTKKKDVSTTSDRRRNHVLEEDKEENKEEDREKEIPAAPVAALPALLPPASLQDVWNQNCGDLPKAAAMNKARITSAKARLKEKPDLDYWRSVVQRIAKSDFCNARVSNSTWRADFEWFLKPGTHLKVLEGKYDAKALPRSGPVPFQSAPKNAPAGVSSAVMAEAAHYLKAREIYGVREATEAADWLGDVRWELLISFTTWPSFVIGGESEQMKRDLWAAIQKQMDLDNAQQQGA